MSTESGTRPSTSGSAMRLSFAQSTASRTRSDTSSGQRRCRPASGMKAYSPGSGASPHSTMTTSFPSWSRASFVESSEPRASPSGFSWVVTTNRSWPRTASATAASSVAVVWGEFIDQLCHAAPTLDGRIVFELQLRSSLHPQLAREPRLEDRMRSLQADERLLPLPLRSQHRDEDARMPEVGGRLDPCHRDEPDAWILELANPFRQHLADRFVDAAHSLGHAAYSSDYSTLTTSRSDRTSSNSCPERYRSASSRSCSASRYSRVTQESVRRARCQSS